MIIARYYNVPSMLLQGKTDNIAARRIDKSAGVHENSLRNTVPPNLGSGKRGC